jgi:hypothetical protein
MAESTPKPYQIRFEIRVDYLYVYVEGEHDSYTISHAYWSEVAGECERLGSRRVMVDENISEGVSVAEMFQIAAELPEMFSGIAIAFVDRHADQAELNEFGELVAQNRGVIGRFFVDFESAEQWLTNT